MEAQLRDIANLEGKKAVTVFGIYDMCKDVVSRYEDLTLKIKRPPKQVGKTIAGRGTGDEHHHGLPYWHIAGAESLGVVAANSILARELLERLQNTGLDGVISFPEEWKDFHAGKLEHALGAESFNIPWF